MYIFFQLNTSFKNITGKLFFTLYSNQNNFCHLVPIAEYSDFEVCYACPKKYPNLLILYRQNYFLGMLESIAYRLMVAALIGI